jgi:hypothetical protein
VPQVIDVKVYEPITPGSNHIQVCKDADGKDVITPVLVQDIRVGPQKDSHSGDVVGKIGAPDLKGINLRASRNVEAGYKRYAMSTDFKQKVQSTLVQDDSLVAGRVEQLQSAAEGSVAWACSQCTYINHTARKKCGMCSASKPQA